MKMDLKLAKSHPGVHDHVGTTLPARELRLLLEGVREWYRGLQHPAQDAGEIEAGRDRIGPPVLGALVGSAGQGKSLLVQALTQICGALELKFVVTRCSETTDEPLAPILDLIHELRLARSTSASGAGLSPLHRGLLARLDARWQSSDVSPLPNLSIELDRARIVSLLAEVIDNLVLRPQVVVVEDLHSIDSMSRAVLERCVRLAKRRDSGVHAGNVLFVVTYRPEKLAVVDGIETFLEPRSLAFEIDCRGYSRSDLQDACLSMFEGGLALSLREKIYRSTGGNPARVQWTLESLRQFQKSTGRIDLDAVRYPGDLEFMVKGLLERLTAEEQALVYLLSFLTGPRTMDEIGQLAAELSKGSGVAEVSIPPHVDTLKKMGALASKGWLRTRQGPLETSLSRWEISNEDVAMVIRQSRGPAAADVFQGEIGNAFIRLGDTIDANTFEVLDQLRHVPDLASGSQFALEAARSAERRGDLEFAVRVRDQLLEALDVEDGELWFTLCLDQAATLEAMGVYRDAIEIYKSVRAGRFREPTAEEKARCQRKMAKLYRHLGESEQQIAALDEGLRIVAADPESREALILSAQLALLCLGSGQQKEAQRLHSEALDRRMALEAAKVDVPLESLRSLEEFQFRTGQFATALETEEVICLQSEASGDFEMLMRSLVYLGHLHARAGRQKFAEECYRRALDRARECGSRRSEADHLVTLGHWCLSNNRKADGLDHLERACDLLVDLGWESSTRELRGIMGATQFQEFSVEDGVRSFESFARLAEKAAEAYEVVSVFPPVYISARERDNTLGALRREVDNGKIESAGRLQIYGDLLVDVGSLSEAEEIYRQALQLPRAKGNPIAVSMLLQKLGRLRRLQGERSEALAYFEKSLECLGPVPEKSVLANAYVEVGKIRMLQGDLAHAYEYILRGLEIFLEVQHPQGIEVALLCLVRYMREIGWCDLARRLACSVHVLSTKSGHLRWEVEACLLLGALEAEAGDGRDSQQYFERVAMLTRTLGLQLPGARLDLEAGWESVRQGDYENAQRVARNCLEAARKLGVQDLLDASMHLLGVVESARGNRSKNFLRAIDLLQRALKGSYRRKSALRTRAILLSMARLYAERDKDDLALKYLQEEAALADVLALTAPEPFQPAFRSVALRRVTRDEASNLPSLNELVQRLAPAPEAV